jgi:hypothetical protein
MAGLGFGVGSWQGSGLEQGLAGAELGRVRFWSGAWWGVRVWSGAWPEQSRVERERGRVRVWSSVSRYYDIYQKLKFVHSTNFLQLYCLIFYNFSIYMLYYALKYFYLCQKNNKCTSHMYTH